MDDADGPEDPNQRVQMSAETFIRQLFGPMMMGAAGAGGPREGGPRFTVREFPPRGAEGGGALPGLGLEGQNFLHDLIHNLAGVDGGERGAAHFHFMPANMGAGMTLYGNPGDYAWGRGGIDAIVTQLMNQMEEAGPPPMKTEDIQQLPTVEITAQHLEEKSQCSVCWEDFKPKEQVKQLKCDHLFHENCIVPWLELHDTCPVCRKSQREMDKDASGGQMDTSDQIGNQPSTEGASQTRSNPSGAIFPNLISSVFGLVGGGSSNPRGRSNRSDERPSTSTTSDSTTSTTHSTPSSSSSASSSSSSSSQSQTTTSNPQSSASHRPSSGAEYQDFDLE